MTQEKTMQHDRRNLLKVFGLSSAAIVGASGDVEKVTDTSPAPHPRERALGASAWNYSYDVVSQVLYDRQLLKLANDNFGGSPRLRARYNFFCDGWQMQRGPEDTNVYQACMLDAPELFKISKVGITFDPGMPERDRLAVIRSYELKLWVGQKYFIQAPLVEAHGWGSDPTAEFKTLFDLDIPLVLVYGHSFRLELSSRNPPLVDGENYAWAVFHGQKARGVQ